ncbi:MAG: biopolymer transporter ExbD [Pirellulaceae bacterium]|nr:biopolymer transporter ExbD [Pirellulaceae bacterium]
MRVPDHTRGGDLGFNMTPMIDVVFLLIIFFLVSSHLAKQEVQMPLPLPTAANGARPVETAARRLTINVLGDGRLLLAGKPVETDELRQRLAAARAESGADLEVRVRGDRTVAYRHVESILLACARAGIWNVAFAVYRPEDVR